VTQEVVLLYAGLVVIAVTLAHIGVWSPRKLWVKLLALGAIAAFFPLGYTSLAELLGRPKPVSLEWIHRHAPAADLIGASMREGEAIYVWLQLPEETEPRAYRLPWSRQLAQQLQGAQAQAEKNRTGVEMKAPFEESLERREPMFHARPQEALPEKPRPAEAPQFIAPQVSPQQSLVPKGG
jgi:hypothetical protein